MIFAVLLCIFVSIQGYFASDSENEFMKIYNDYINELNESLTIIADDMASKIQEISSTWPQDGPLTLDESKALSMIYKDHIVEAMEIYTAQIILATQNDSSSYFDVSNEDSQEIVQHDSDDNLEDPSESDEVNAELMLDALDQVLYDFLNYEDESELRKRSRFSAIRYISGQKPVIPNAQSFDNTISTSHDGDVFLDAPQSIDELSTFQFGDTKSSYGRPGLQSDELSQSELDEFLDAEQGPIDFHNMKPGKQSQRPGKQSKIESNNKKLGSELPSVAKQKRKWTKYLMHKIIDTKKFAKKVFSAPGIVVRSVRSTWKSLNGPIVKPLARYYLRLQCMKFFSFSRKVRQAAKAELDSLHESIRYLIEFKNFAKYKWAQISKYFK